MTRNNECFNKMTESRSDSARNTIEQNLRNETEKWQMRIEDKINTMELKDRENKEHQRMLKNIHAYIADCRHFQKNNDLIRAFEAIVWAWSWLEILEQLGIIRIINP